MSVEPVLTYDEVEANRRLRAAERVIAVAREAAKASTATSEHTLIALRDMLADYDAALDDAGTTDRQG